MRKVALATMAALILWGCGVRKTKQSFSELEDEFLYTTLSFSPVGATSAGYHQHQGIRLDQQLDDFSPASLERQKRFYESIRSRLQDAHEDVKHSTEDLADFDVIVDQIELAQLELVLIQ